MLSDAHCHPHDLNRIFSGAEEERRRLGVICAASSTSLEEFEYHEALSGEARAGGFPPLVLCFAVHPQLPASIADPGEEPETGKKLGLDTLDTLARGGRLGAIGETGFDLFNAAFRETEKIQDELFQAHLETALSLDLPLVLHVRRAMHKIFAYAKELKRCQALIFHSWSGTAGEAESFLKRGMNVFFSFGTTLLLNHREAMRCCASCPPDRLLLETDAPWQPLRGKAYSSWADLPAVIEAAAALRRQTAGPGGTVEELETLTENNFRRAFALGDH
jgi:TatD DNase family protein